MASTAKIALCLTGRTIEEDLELIKQYKDYIDMVELRVDYLDDDEKLFIRKFPSLAKIPTILTIRRHCDGGKFCDGEANRTTLFARGLAYADQDSRKNFTYVDIETDFDVPCLQDAALAFGTKIIRSFHSIESPIDEIEKKFRSIRKTGFEIPKIAFKPKNLQDVSNLMKESARIKDYEHIAIALGPLGLPSRILATKINSCITYVSAKNSPEDFAFLGQIDPITLTQTYNFRQINEDTSVFGIMGYPLKFTNSPKFHNENFKKRKMNCVYIPIRCENAEETVQFADANNIKGLSVTLPFKKDILKSGVLNFISETTGEVQAANTILKTCEGWKGFNTDVNGFIKSFLEFSGYRNLFFKKIAIIGAGGAANACAYAVKKLRGNACIFNRTLSKAREIANLYGFRYAPLNADYLYALEKYNDIIIQTTSVGFGCEQDSESNKKNDPIFFYEFKGFEKVFDLIYLPEKTPMLARAEKAGCSICNGSNMLEYQGIDQFELFTGEKY